MSDSPQGESAGENFLPTVSVVIPTYRRTEQLRRALASVENQTYEGEIEAIVVDNNEKPIARAVAEPFTVARYHHMLEYFPRDEDTSLTVAMARDVGVSNARGKYVQFLDDDDELASVAISRKIEVLEAAPTAGGVYNAIELTNGEVLRNEPIISGNELAYILQTLQSPAPPSTLLVARSSLLACGPQRLQTHNDFGTLVEILLRTRLVYVDEPLTIRDHSDGMRSSPYSERRRLATGRRYAGLRRELLMEE